MTAAVACAVAATIASCGGSDDIGGGEALTAAELRQRAHRICARAVSDVAAIRAEPGQTSAEGRRWVEQRNVIQTAALEKLAALQPPDDVRPAYDELLVSLERATEMAHDSQLRLVEGKSINFDEGNQMHEELAERTRATKLTACQWM